MNSYLGVSDGREEAPVTEKETRILANIDIP